MGKHGGLVSTMGVVTKEEIGNQPSIIIAKSLIGKDSLSH